MIRLPEDLEEELVKKYPDANVRSIIQALFTGMMEKALKDGCCNVREFGKFEAYKTTSTKLGAEVIRFKFKISPALEKKIKFDEYLLNNAPVRAKVPFTEQHQLKCNQEIKKSNIEASREASQLGIQRTKEKMMTSLVKDLINDQN